jgi:hypothetical protein
MPTSHESLPLGHLMPYPLADLLTRCLLRLKRLCGQTPGEEPPKPPEPPPAWLAVCARPATRAFTRASAFSIARSSFCGDFFVCGTQRARAQRPVSAAPWPRAVKTTFVAVVEAALASNAQAAFTEEVVLHRTMSNPCVPRVSKSVDSNPRQLSQLSQL